METLKSKVVNRIRRYASKRLASLDFGPEFISSRTVHTFKEIVAKPIKPHKSVKDLLNKHNYDIIDYRSGIAEDRTNKRKTKIGKILAKHGNNRIKKVFDERLKGKLKSNQNLVIVFSHDPIDIALMSTNRGWTSCMDLNDDSSYRSQVFNKIRYGGMVAYITNEKDVNLENPIGRISIRRFSSKNYFVLKAEDTVYGAEVNGFKKYVKKVLNENNKYTCPLAPNEYMTLMDAEGGYSDTYNDEDIIVGRRRYRNYTGMVYINHERIEVEKATFEIEEDGEIDWENGTWKRGTWPGGNWKNGYFAGEVWTKGFWHDGTFAGRKWKNGMWIDGYWECGKWIKGTGGEDREFLL